MKPRLLVCMAAAFCMAAGALIAGQGAAPPPQAPLTFRVEVNFVEVDAVVTDEQGNFVPDLTASDFELSEDRRPQTITAFSLVNLPIEREVRPLFAASAIEPDVQTNAIGEGRLYLIVLDNLHTNQENVFKVRAAARQFIERNFAANDMAAVVFTGTNSRDTQDFTNNRRLLLQAIDKFIGLKTPSATTSMMRELQANIGRQPGDPVRDEFEAERSLQARNTMERLRKLSEFMANVRGRRKTMLLISEGVDYDFRDIIGNMHASGVLEAVRDAIGTATRANVAIYAIDPRGLSNPNAELAEFQSLPSMTDPSLGRLGPLSAADELRVSQDSLRQLAEETGGFAVVNQNDFNNAFQRIVRDNSSYYVLGYYPSNERRDGRYRTINVRVKRPGLQVRFRRGYIAPRGRVPAGASAVPANPVAAALGEAMNSPLPVSGIPMTAFVAPFKGTAPKANVAVAIEMGVNGFTFTEANGTFNNLVEMALVAADTDGKQAARNLHSLTLKLRPDTMERSRTRGLRVLTQIELPPGRYQLRVAAAEAGAGTVGSVITSIEVPDFYKQPITMSGLALTAASAAQTATVKQSDPLEQFLPGPVTTSREFARSDQIALFAEFYENLRDAPPHKIDISTTIRTDDGRIVKRDEQQRDSTELQGGRGGYGFSTVLPLSDLEPGLYVIHVEARSRAAGPESGVGRDIQITVK